MKVTVRELLTHLNMSDYGIGDNPSFTVTEARCKAIIDSLRDGSMRTIPVYMCADRWILFNAGRIIHAILLTKETDTSILDLVVTLSCSSPYS